MSETIDQKRIDHIDSLYWSPKERAEGVHQIVMEALDKHAEAYGEDARPSFWDLVCWAVEYTSQQSMAIQDPRFMSICIQLNRQMWQLHYSNAEDIYPREDKLEDERRAARDGHEEAGRSDNVASFGNVLPPRHGPIRGTVDDSDEEPEAGS